jgi:putative hydrolase of the HAD superfamily
VVSNCDHATRPIVDELGLADEADAVLLSFEVGVAKPDAGIYRAALDALGAQPEGSVFVDDQAGYCDGAEALGIRSILILRDDAFPVEGTSVTGDREVIHDLRSLLDLV